MVPVLEVWFFFFFKVVSFPPSSFLSTRARRLCSSPARWGRRLSPRCTPTVRSPPGFSKRSEPTHASKVHASLLLIHFKHFQCQFHQLDIHSDLWLWFRTFLKKKKSFKTLANFLFKMTRYLKKWLPGSHANDVPALMTSIHLFFLINTF